MQFSYKNVLGGDRNEVPALNALTFVSVMIGNDKSVNYPGVDLVYNDISINTINKN